MKICFKLILALPLFLFVGCLSWLFEPYEPYPELPPERYGSNPNNSVTIANNSSQPIIVLFKDGLIITIDRDHDKKITIKELIDSGCSFEESKDQNYDFGIRDPSAPSQTQIISYRVITENGAKVRLTSASGVFIFMDDTTGNEIIAIKNASKAISGSLKKDAKIAVVNISSSDSEKSEFVVGEIEVFLVNSGLFVVDRRELDRIRREQSFQLSGDVDDNDVVSIGRFAGADVVITGSITGTDATRRLRIRALDTQTARIIAAASEAY